jgi:hypothetical protein
MAFEQNAKNWLRSKWRKNISKMLTYSKVPNLGFEVSNWIFYYLKLKNCAFELFSTKYTRNYQKKDGFIIFFYYKTSFICIVFVSGSFLFQSFSQFYQIQSACHIKYTVLNDLFSFIQNKIKAFNDQFMA